MASAELSHVRRAAAEPGLTGRGRKSPDRGGAGIVLACAAQEWHRDRGTRRRLAAGRARLAAEPAPAIHSEAIDDSCAVQLSRRQQSNHAHKAPRRARPSQEIPEQPETARFPPGSRLAPVTEELSKPPR